jgi:hypothetical protein
MGAVIEKDLRARAARSGVAHRPEIIGSGDADDPRFREAGDLLPQVEGLIVLGIDGGEQAILGQPVFPGDELPGPGDGIGLEVVAEGEIAEHLEEGVMAGGVADIVEIIVLAAGAHAFLGGGGAPVGPLLGTGEHVLELHHPRIGEHEGRVVARHQRRRGDHFMAVLLEEIEEGGADLGKPGHARKTRLSRGAFGSRVLS